MGFNEVWWGIGFPILLAAVGFGITFGVIDSSAAEFTFARICFLVAAFDAGGFLVIWLWLVSKISQLFRFALGAIGAALLAEGVNLALPWVDLREVQLSKTLTSRNVETPPIPARCEAPKGAVLVFLGSNLAFAAKMPSAIIAMGGRDMLAIDMDEHQRLLIKTLRILDDKNEMIARIEDDEFSVAPSVRHVKPDESTFIVYDQNNVEVLRISYLNIQAVSIRGQFHGENLPPLIIADDKAQLGDHTFLDSCLGDLARGEIFSAQ
jgi:hypothetical protein